MSSYHHGNLRTALLTRAIETIGENGVEGLSLRQLARDLSVSHAAPARHFPAKADLLAAIVTESFEELTKLIYAALDDPAGLSASQTLNKIAQLAMRWAIDNPAKFSVMTNPDVSRFAREETVAALAAFAEAIRNAISNATEEGVDITAPNNDFLLFAVGAVLGASTLMTDKMMKAAFVGDQDNAPIETIANLIISDREGS